MNLCFMLTMPNRGSWNGLWSGENEIYAIIKKFSNTKKNKTKVESLLKEGSWFYSWTDGWSASISVKEVEGKELRRIRKESRGFCGYEWMVESILRYNVIYADHQRPVEPLELPPVSVHHDPNVTGGYTI